MRPGNAAPAQKMSPNHPQLTGSPDSIRLLRLLPGFSGQAVSCTTHAVNLTNKPKYFALSYMWGPESPTHEVLLNAKAFRIRENLWHFLKRIRSEDYSLTLWCDQLCIDEENEGEKNRQVQNMGKIYQTADETWLWLGELGQSMSTTMTFVSRIAKIYDQIALNVDILDKMSTGHWWRSNRVSLEDRADMFAQELESLLNSTNARDYDRGVIAQAAQQCHFFNLWKIAQEVTSVYQELHPSGSADALCVHDLMQELGSREYWGRAWIIQELLLSSTITIFAGSVSMPFWIFQDLITYRVSSILDHNNQSSHVSEKARHVGMYAWPIGQIAGMVARYHPSWWSRSTLSTRSLVEIENIFNHEKWPQSPEQQSHISPAAGLAKLKTDLGRSGSTGATVLTLQDCLRLVSRSQCFDWRDKVFSVLAISAEHSEGIQFPIDYSCTREELFFDTMQSSYLVPLLIERANDISLALSLSLINLIKTGKNSGQLREASTTSNDGISVVSLRPFGLIHHVQPQTRPGHTSLDLQFEFGCPKSIEVFVFTYERERKVQPGHFLFRASRTCCAITESINGGSAVVGWAQLLSNEITSFDYEAMANLKLHDKHGHTKEYAEKHLCLNEKQVLVLLSTEIGAANTKGLV